MELRHLRYFVAVVEAGSFTTAAEHRLHTSQPSLSRQIRDLEYRVGTELLSRSVHGVELTAAGKAFLEHARLALMQVDAAVEAARRAAEPARKRFAIGFQTGHEMNWLPGAMHVPTTGPTRRPRSAAGSPSGPASICISRPPGRRG
jgi:LysR family transcriptional regulator, hca operon transcriptional activator